MPKHPVPENTTEEEARRDLESRGVKKFFNMVYPLNDGETGPLNRWNLERCSAWPGAHPVCSLHIDTRDKPAVAEDLFLAGSRGIKLHPFIQKFNPSSGEFGPLYRRMGEMGMPLFLHTGYDAWYGMKFPVSDIESIVSANPEMPVVLVHMIFPHIHEAFRILENHENAILDATNVPGSFEYARAKGFPLDGKMLDIFIRGTEENRERVLYGSDYPVGMGSLERIHDDFLALGFSDGTIAAVTGKNAERLLDDTRRKRESLERRPSRSRPGKQETTISE